MTFLAKRDGDLVPRIVSDVTGWGEHPDGTFDFNTGAMARVAGSDWYALEARVAPGARIEYLIAYGAGDYRLDPHNARPGLEQPPASEFVMPEYVPPEESADLPVAGGRPGRRGPPSRAPRSGGRAAGVYTPPGYRRDGTYPLAVFPDRPSGPVPRVLDWLIARGAIEPIVAVFAETDVRGAASFPAEEMRAFLTRELPAWLAPRYGVTRSADQRAIIGISFSAKDALDAALAPAGTFGRLGMLIPGRRITRTDIDSNRLAASPPPASCHPGRPVRQREPRDGTRRAAGARGRRPSRVLHGGARGPHAENVAQPLARGACQPLRAPERRRAAMTVGPRQPHIRTIATI